MKNLLKEYFLENLALYPERDALEVQGQTYSYQAFYEIVSTLMASIQKQNIKDKAIVVLNDHSVYSYASILAVQFSGNAFLPLELLWPGNRLEEILKTVKAAAVFVSSEDQMNKIVAKAPAAGELLFINSNTGEQYNAGAGDTEHSDYKQVSYILFTSGSTGIPKGVPVSHKNLNAFLKFNKDFFDFSKSDRFLQVYELTFDVAYFSFFVPLCVGACCCILEQKKSMPKFISIVNDLLHRDITIVSMVPTIINLSKRLIKNKEAATVRHCFFIGDVLYHSEASLWQNFIKKGIIHNYYGPTEVTIACSDYEWRYDTSAVDLSKDSVPIGKVFSGLKFKIVNEEMLDVSYGETGELLLSGAQVVDGYVNKVHPEKFVSVNEGGTPEVYYRTGDLVSLNSESDLIFHGRMDHQVKLNGHRIELNEIQLAIGKQTGRKVIVLKKQREDGFYALSAAIEGTEFPVENLKEELHKILPEHMVPSEFVFLPQLPLTEAGKIDMRSLQNYSL